LEQIGGIADGQLIEQLSGTVKAVEEELHQLVKSQAPLVNAIGAHTLHAGGKRLRPAFLSLSAAATGREFDRQRAIKLGACLELVHMATLIHDDVVDHADLRRGKATAATVYGNAPSILSGDVFLARAMQGLAEDGDVEIIRTVAKSVVEIAEGEVSELAARGNFEVSLDEHLRILKMKTAAFIECCCGVGARIAGASDSVVKSLSSYGQHVGMAFQIADDLLDYRAKASETGKAPARDFREGCATLPLIALRSELTTEERSFVSSEFGTAASDDVVEMIEGWMNARGAYDFAERMAIEQSESAIAAIQDLPENSERNLLRSVAEYVVSRKA